jgi:hypothetical protein
MDSKEENTTPQAPAQGEVLAQAYLRRLLGRVEDGYFAYENAVPKSEEEADAKKEWQDAKNEIRDIFTTLLQALRTYGRHGAVGGPICERSKHSDYPCTCGFDAAMAAAERGAA